MNVYRCDITLMEATFFSSREIGGLYQTEPLIGNYALAYALGFAVSGYYNDGSIGYKDDLTRLNEAGIYITPAAMVDTPRFLLRTFNAQTDGYWSAYGAGVIVGRSDEGWSEKRGQHWYTIEPDGNERRHNPTNRPQAGRMRILAAQNRLIAYVFSAQELVLPRYIRLGKFMSKARLDSVASSFRVVDATDAVIEHLLNPADLPPECHLTVFDMVNLPPMPLIRNALVSGPLYRLAEGVLLPVGMRFNVEGLP